MEAGVLKETRIRHGPASASTRCSGRHMELLAGVTSAREPPPTPGQVEVLQPV
ncbi:hypothetical protein JYU34_015950 [Plutella xylostella]|uniref:Uncharacterized protein n=1 Tax=Plutella xylostella TaxID=51655 RepID=A0ABQ7Q534_PLUXY|nr:hypothetical protein JYU34_015950 [Plutella xylostella]